MFDKACKLVFYLFSFILIGYMLYLGITKTTLNDIICSLEYLGILIFGLMFINGMVLCITSSIKENKINEIDKND